MFARHGRGPEPDREGTARYASFVLFGQDLGPRTSREHKFAFDELYRSSGLQYAARNGLFFGKAFRLSEKPDNAAGSNTVTSERYVGHGSAKRGKASVAGIAMVL